VRERTLLIVYSPGEYPGRFGGRSVPKARSGERRAVSRFYLEARPIF
jgi:hypothetical protein